MRAFSAGGVLFRRVPAPTQPAPALAPVYPRPAVARADIAARIEVVLVGQASEDFWVLPKGTPQPNETTEQVALREVAEETGVMGRIVGEIGSIHYWFSRHGVRYSKEVFYYLMEAIGGDVAQHDHEYNDARWFPLEEAPDRLTYANEAEIVRNARDAILR